MIHDLEDRVRADLQPAADSLTFEPDLDAIVREGQKGSRRNRWGRGALAVAAMAAVAVAGLQFMNRTVPALPPAPLGQPSDTDSPLNEATRTHLPSETNPAGVDAVMTQDGRRVVFTSGTARIQVAVPETGRVAWSQESAPFAAMVINGPATSVRLLPSNGLLGVTGWALVQMPGTTLTVAAMGLSESSRFDVNALVWGDGAGGFHSVDGRADSVVRFTMTAPWFETQHPTRWVVVEDPVAGVIVWPEDSAHSGAFDVLSTGPSSELRLYSAASVEATPNPGADVTVVAFAVLPAGKGQVILDHAAGYSAVDPPVSQRLASGLDVVLSTWRGPMPIMGKPSLSLTYTTADGRQVVLTP